MTGLTIGAVMHVRGMAPESYGNKEKNILFSFDIFLLRIIVYLISSLMNAYGERWIGERRTCGESSQEKEEISPYRKKNEHFSFLCRSALWIEILGVLWEIDGAEPSGSSDGSENY